MAQPADTFTKGESKQQSSTSLVPVKSSAPIPLDVHRAVFTNDVKRLAQLLESKKFDVNAAESVHGNTPLILAALLGHGECVALLLANGATVKIRNSHGWSALAESISFGDRALIMQLWKVYKARAKDELKKRTPEIMEKIEKIGDFYLAIHWKFSSWVPFVSRILPSDTYRIWKKGKQVRCDTTLVDFENMSWKRGDVSYLVKVGDEGTQSVTIVDHKEKAYANVRTKEDDKEAEEALEEEVDEFMGAPLQSMTSPGKVEFARARGGIPGWRHDKTEKVGEYDTRVYGVKNINLCIRKRTEHLSEADLKEQEAAQELWKDGAKLEQKLKEDEEKERLRAQKRLNGKKPHKEKEKEKDGAKDKEAKETTAILPSTSTASATASASASTSEGSQTVSASATETTNGDVAKEKEKETETGEHTGAEEEESGDEEEDDEPIEHRKSLPRPEVPKFGADEYFSPAGSAIHLGRPMVVKEENKKFTATVCMCDNFPLTIDTVVSLLEMAAPRHKHVEKLKEFIQNTLPPGFPIKLEMPVFPTITALVTFMDYSNKPVDIARFAIPDDYKNDPAKFKQLQNQQPTA